MCQAFVSHFCCPGDEICDSIGWTVSRVPAQLLPRAAVLRAVVMCSLWSRDLRLCWRWGLEIGHCKFCWSCCLKLQIPNVCHQSSYNLLVYHRFFELFNLIVETIQILTVFPKRNMLGVFDLTPPQSPTKFDLLFKRDFGSEKKSQNGVPSPHVQHSWRTKLGLWRKKWGMYMWEDWGLWLSLRTLRKKTGFCG